MEKNRFLESISKGEFSLVIVRDGKVMVKSNSSGVSALIKASENGFLEKSTIFDKTIGLGAAKIIVWSGGTGITCLTASRRAVIFCKKNNIKIKSNKIKRFLGMETSKETCEIEKISSNFNDLENLIKNLKITSNAFLEKAPKDGVFPLNYYTTTNYKTSIRIDDNWLIVQNSEMDKGIRVSKDHLGAETITGNMVKKGDLIVVDDFGIKIEYHQKDLENSGFGFMTGEVSTERAKTLIIEKLATEMKRIKENNGRVLLVAGPAIVHTGASPYVADFIKKGFINVLFTGNALAVHDVERAYLGTSLGVNLKTGRLVNEGYHNHLHTINMVRYYGSISEAVKLNVINSGIMYETVRSKIPYILAGSIRDDGPLPDVITDSQIAQQKMREEVRKGIDLAIMVATTLHSVATGNLLPAWVKKVIVDTNPSTIIKLSDRGTTGSVSLLTDCEFFFSELSKYLL